MTALEQCQHRPRRPSAALEQRWHTHAVHQIYQHSLPRAGAARRWSPRHMLRVQESSARMCALRAPPPARRCRAATCPSAAAPVAQLFHNTCHAAALTYSTTQFRPTRDVCVCVEVLFPCFICSCRACLTALAHAGAATSAASSVHACTWVQGAGGEHDTTRVSPSAHMHSAVNDGRARPFRQTHFICGRRQLMWHCNGNSRQWNEL